MPHTRFQIVFNTDEDEVEFLILIDDELRKTRVNFDDAPVSREVLGDEAAAAAVKAWLLKARAPAWMSWIDLEDAFLTAGLDVARLARDYPPR